MMKKKAKRTKGQTSLEYLLIIVIAIIIIIAVWYWTSGAKVEIGWRGSGQIESFWDEDYIEIKSAPDGFLDFGEGRLQIGV